MSDGWWRFTCGNVCEFCLYVLFILHNAYNLFIHLLFYFAQFVFIVHCARCLCSLCTVFEIEICEQCTMCAQLHHRFLHFPHFHPLCPHTVTWQPLHSTIVLVFSAYLTTCQCTPSWLMLQIFPAQLALCTHQSVFTLVRVQLPKSPSCSIHLRAGTLYKHLHRRLHPAKGSEAQLCWTGLSWTIQGWRSSSAVFCLGVRQQSREEKSEGGRVRQAALYHRWRQQEGPTMEVTSRLNIIIIFNQVRKETFWSTMCPQKLNI